MNTVPMSAEALRRVAVYEKPTCPFTGMAGIVILAHHAARAQIELRAVKTLERSQLARGSPPSSAPHGDGISSRPRIQLTRGSTG